MLRIYIGFQVIKFHCFPSSSFLLFIPLLAPPPTSPPPAPLLLLLLLLLLLISILFPPSHSIVFPPPPHFYCFPASSSYSSSSSFYCFPSFSSSSFLLFSLLLLLLLLISIVFPPPPPHSIVFFAHSFNFFSTLDSIKDCQLPSFVHFEEMSRAVNKNRGFLQLLADCPAYQRQFLLKTATPQQLHALVQVLYNIRKGHIPIPEENKRIMLPYKCALLDLA